jgi:hypothetical protein
MFHSGRPHRRWRGWVVLVVSALLSGLFVSAGGPASASNPWSVVPSENPGTQSNLFAGVSCATETFCVAVGTSSGPAASQTLIETWNGTGWATTSSPNVSGAPSSLSGVSCASPTFCVAVGSAQVGAPFASLIEHWDGMSWTIVPSPNPGSSTSLRAVSCASSTFCVAVGNFSVGNGGTQQTVIEIWDGTSWSMSSSPNPTTSDLFYGVSCTSPSFCVAVGSAAGAGGSSSQTLVETWDGTAWSVTPSPDVPNVADYLLSVSCTSTAFCVGMGHAGSRVVIEIWDGASWSISTSPSPDVISGYGVSCWSSTACVGVGYRIASSSTGSTWSSIAVPTGGVLYAVSCVGVTFCLAVGTVQDSGSTATLAMTGTGAALPGAPTIGSATPGDSSASVTFTPPADNGGSSITSYTARCTSANGGAAGQVSGSGSPLLVSGLTNGKSYTCFVTATNEIGTGPASSRSNSAKAATVPGAPTSATAISGSTTTTTGSLTVRYAAPTSNGGDAVISYSATCTSSNGGVTKTATHTGPNAVAIVVAGLTTGKTYKCTIKATNHMGSGPASAPTGPVIVGAPAVVTNVRLVPGSANVQTGSLMVTFSIGADNGSAITSQTATCTSSSGGVTKTGTHTGAAAAPISVAGVTTGVPYTCQVRATNARGAGPASAASAPVIVGSPAPPTGVKAESGAAFATGSVVVSFAPGANNGSAISDFAATCTSSNGGNTQVASKATSPITVTTLTTGATYSCTVAATNARGDGPASKPSLPVIVGSPAPPTGVSAVHVASGSLRVTFTPGANNGSATTSYTTTCLSTNGGLSGSQTGSASPLTVVGLSVGKTYRCTVRGDNARGAGSESTPSATATA